MSWIDHMHPVEYVVFLVGLWQLGVWTGRGLAMLGGVIAKRKAANE